MFISYFIWTRPEKGGFGKKIKKGGGFVHIGGGGGVSLKGGVQLTIDFNQFDQII